MLKGQAKKDYQRDLMRRKRSNTGGLTSDGSNRGGLTSDKPRYLTLSDGQVLDREAPVKGRALSGAELQSMVAANRSNSTMWDPVRAERYRLWREGKSSNERPIIEAIARPKERGELRSICESLGKHRVLDKVYFGCGNDPVRMDEVAEFIGALS